MADQVFNTDGGFAVIPDGLTSVTLVAGVDYPTPTGEAFMMLVGTRHTGMGATSGGGAQDAEDFTCWIDNPDNLAASITIKRTGTIGDCRVAWQIIDYVGPDAVSGGDHAIKVRQVARMDFTNEFSKTSGAIASVDDTSRCLVLITGQGTEDPSRGRWHTGLFTADIGAGLPSGGEVTISRGFEARDAHISYAVIEFTGLSWSSVRRLEVDGTQTSAPISPPLASLSRTFCHVQYRNDNGGLDGLDSWGDAVGIDTVSAIGIDSEWGNANAVSVVWLVENSQTTDGMVVEHVSYFHAQNDDTEETIEPIAINTVDTGNASIMGACCNCSGTGDTQPRGSYVFKLESAQVDARQSDNGQDNDIRLDVVQWPMQSASGGTTLSDVSDVLTPVSSALAITAAATLAAISSAVMLTSEVSPVVAETSLSASVSSVSLTDAVSAAVGEAGLQPVTDSVSLMSVTEPLQAKTTLGLVTSEVALASVVTPASAASELSGVTDTVGLTDDVSSLSTGVPLGNVSDTVLMTATVDPVSASAVLSVPPSGIALSDNVSPIQPTASLNPTVDLLQITTEVSPLSQGIVLGPVVDSVVLSDQPSAVVGHTQLGATVDILAPTDSVSPLGAGITLFPVVDLVGITGTVEPLSAGTQLQGAVEEILLTSSVTPIDAGDPATPISLKSLSATEFLSSRSATTPFYSLPLPGA